MPSARFLLWWCKSKAARTSTQAESPPVLMSMSAAGEATWVSGRDYLELVEALMVRQDGSFDREVAKHKRAGFLFHESALRKILGEREASTRARNEYQDTFDKAGR